MRHILSLIAMLMLSVGAARAEPYVLAGIGAAETKALGGTDATFPAWLGAGYRRGPWAVEATYASLDHVDEIVSTRTTTLSSRRWSGKGPGLFAVGHYGSFLVRAGAYRLHSEVTGAESRSETIWTPALGLGWQTQLGARLAARATFEYVRGRADFSYSRIIGTSVLYTF